MIVVAGGTGRLGARVVRRLRADGHAVEAWGRRDGDLREVTADRLVGADAVVSAVTGFPDQSPAGVDWDGNRALIDAANHVGAHVVLVSVLGAAPDSPMRLFRAKHSAEEHLRRAGGSWTIVRPDAFLETWVDILEQTAGRSKRPLVFGRGDNPFAWVPVDDVAAVVATAATDRGLRGRTIQVEGPERLTLEELATRVMRDHGWTGTPRKVPRAILHVLAMLPGQQGRMAQASLAMDVLGRPAQRVKG